MVTVPNFSASSSSRLSMSSLPDVSRRRKKTLGSEVMTCMCFETVRKTPKPMRVAMWIQ
ncbi:hypothetical protein D3C72_2135920 [compost metagenome]